MKKIKDMNPNELVERAEKLIQQIDDKFDNNGMRINGASWSVPPTELALAEQLLFLASIKWDPEMFPERPLY